MPTSQASAERQESPLEGMGDTASASIGDGS